MAANIFHDFGNSPFAGHKRAVKINLVQFLQDIYSYQHLTPLGDEVLNETFSCRYSAFGLARISLPVDRIINACGYKLAAEISERWDS